MSRGSASAKEFFIEHEGNPEYADEIEFLVQQIQLERGFKSEDRARQALQVLKNSGEILDFEDATGTDEDWYHSTDFWITLRSGRRRRVQVKSSAHAIREYSHQPKYDEISFLVVKSSDLLEDVVDKIRQFILSKNR